MPRPAAAASAQAAGSLARAASRARAAHQRGLQAGSAWRPAVAARQVRAGLLALGWAEGSDLPDTAQLPACHHALAARLLMSLAHFESEQGRTTYGLGLLDRAEPLAATADRGVLLSQRGLLNMRTWRGAAALPLLDEAAALLQDYPDRSYLARTLLNRSFLHLNNGDVLRARADLAGCERVCAEHGLSLMTAKAVHNRGYCELLAGDLPAALQLFNLAADGYRQQAPSALPVLAMDKARALLAAWPARLPGNSTARLPHSGGSALTKITLKPSWLVPRPRWRPAIWPARADGRPPRCADSAGGAMTPARTWPS